MSELACAYVLCAYAGRSICDARFSCAQCRRTTPAGILVLICFFPRLWCRRGGGVKVMAAFVNVFVALMPKSPTRMVLKRHYSVHSLAFIFGYPLLATRSADVAVKCESGVVCIRYVLVCSDANFLPRMVSKRFYVAILIFISRYPFLITRCGACVAI